MSYPIQTAALDWQLIDNIEVPVSRQFGDVYFSKDNGLLETRHVFLNGNDLTERLATLNDFEYFCVGETGFGTGLNILALWQLWQQVRPDNHSHLHAISVEKFPLGKPDLIRALKAWPELAPLAEQLLQQYPLLIAGCHRLSFPEERFSLDLWLGDAHDMFPLMEKTASVNAWFLDGFAPSCNPDMWEEQVLNHIVRLSDHGTTFASFSVAGVLKRGLRSHGIQVTRPRGFGHKREMLKAIWQPSVADAATEKQEKPESLSSGQLLPRIAVKTTHRQKQIAVIGAGIAGLSVAWSFAQRGHQVKLFDRNAPLAGASGNPLALLNPKLSQIEKSHIHLMTITWQYALNHYQQFRAFRPLQIHQMALKESEQLLSLAEQYPHELLTIQTAQCHPLSTQFESLRLNRAGGVSPHLLRDQILEHSLIQFAQAAVEHIIPEAQDTVLYDANGKSLGKFDHVVVCCARQSQSLLSNCPKLRPIRGQVSWVNNTVQPLNMQEAISYGGYCLQFDPENLLLGASFLPGREDDEVLAEDHQHNAELLAKVFPEYAATLPPIEAWQGRASIRAQTMDYFPLLGKMGSDTEIYTFSGLGSKGFLYAPLCSEILAALVFKEACPVPASVVQKLNPQRFQKRLKQQRNS